MSTPVQQKPTQGFKVFCVLATAFVSGLFGTIAYYFICVPPLGTIAGTALIISLLPGWYKTTQVLRGRPWA